MLKQEARRKRQFMLPSRKIAKEMHIYEFPTICGLESISEKLNRFPAENIFGALLHALPLKPILNTASVCKAEKMLEYLGRAFENQFPKQVEYYLHILTMLLQEYDDIHHVRASKNIPPHEFLKIILLEDNLTQKSLVPECFPNESQVSEFLHQKKGRKKLSYEQAVLLGKKFKVDPLNFL